jgi:hypothetical protein
MHPRVSKKTALYWLSFAFWRQARNAITGLFDLTLADGGCGGHVVDSMKSARTSRI